MNRVLFLFLLFFICNTGFCQTDIHSFECRLNADYKGFTQSQITSFIAQSNLEKFRLFNKRVTLTFDNGFDIILLSANELQQKGIIKDVTTYLTEFPAHYKMPVFHINETGQIAAKYDARNTVKYSNVKH